MMLANRLEEVNPEVHKISAKEILENDVFINNLKGRAEKEIYENVSRTTKDGWHYTEPGRLLGFAVFNR